MTRLAHKLGFSPGLAFHDVYSFTDPDLLALVPRPALGLLFIHACTETSDRFRDDDERRRLEQQQGKQPASGGLANGTRIGASSGKQPLFFHQTITHACGLYALLHILLNGPAREHILPSSFLAKLLAEAEPLSISERSRLLEQSDELERAHEESAAQGQSTAPVRGVEPGNAFLSFVVVRDEFDGPGGWRLWELEGSRSGPIDHGLIAGRDGDDVDALHPDVLDKGPLAFLKREESAGHGGIGFSCIVLGPNVEE